MKKLVLIILTVLSAATFSFGQGPVYKIYALRFAAMKDPTPISVWADKGPDKDSVSINFMVWLIKGDNGKIILFDTGFLADAPDFKDFGIVNYTRPDSTLLKVGIKAADITDVILSHPHWDHIDGLGLFPNAHIWIQKEDYNYFVGAAWEKGGHSGGFYKRDVKTLVNLALDGKVTLVDGDDKELFPGIKVYTGSRHTFNSQFVGVNTGTRKIILASDNIWIYYSLQHMVPASKGGTLDPEGYVRSMQRMKTLVSDEKLIIPGHDANVFLKFPTIVPGVVEIR